MALLSNVIAAFLFNSLWQNLVDNENARAYYAVAIVFLYVVVVVLFVIMMHNLITFREVIIGMWSYLWLVQIVYDFAEIPTEICVWLYTIVNFLGLGFTIIHIYNTGYPNASGEDIVDLISWVMYSLLSIANVVCVAILGGNSQEFYTAFVGLISLVGNAVGKFLRIRAERLAANPSESIDDGGDLRGDDQGQTTVSGDQPAPSKTAASDDSVIVNVAEEDPQKNVILDVAEDTQKNVILDVAEEDPQEKKKKKEQQEASTSEIMMRKTNKPILVLSTSLEITNYKAT